MGPQRIQLNVYTQQATKIKEKIRFRANMKESLELDRWPVAT